MKTIFLIIEREFLTRVKKKSFIILTLLAPLLFAGFIFAYIGVATTKDSKEQNITVIDKSGLLENTLESTNNLKFTFNNTASVNDLKNDFMKSGDHVIVFYVGPLDNENNPTETAVYSDRQVNMDIIRLVRNTLEQQVEARKLAGYDIEGLDRILESIKTTINVKTIKWDTEGKEAETNNVVMMIISYVAALLIYMFIFMFGSMVMRSVIEEKSNRIIEVIVSSVRPFQLMIGKIIGVALVGLVQFLAWILLTFGLLFAAQKIFLGDVQQAATEMAQGMPVEMVQQSAAADMMMEVNNIMNGIPLTTIIVCFFFFFLLGYLLYASMFAAIGSAVENETETQQLILPITIPLILGIFIMVHTFQYPNSPLSFWGSIIPFTSPMVMMARIPFGGVPFWQIGLSLSVLVVTFLLFVWLSGKIYRVGILMYGKKASFKELWKWMWYKS